MSWPEFEIEEIRMLKEEIITLKKEIITLKKSVLGFQHDAYMAEMMYSRAIGKDADDFYLPKLEKNQQELDKYEEE